VGVATAIYLGKTHEQVGRELLERSMQAASCPVRDQIAALEIPDLIPKGIVHLYKIARRERDSMRHLSQLEAWRVIGREPGDSIAWILRKAQA
jgi:hypothetical protein